MFVNKPIAWCIICIACILELPRVNAGNSGQNADSPYVNIAMVVPQPANVSISKPYQAAELLSKLQEMHQIQIFFRESWFDDRDYAGEILEQSLTEALNSLIRGQQLKLITLSGMIFIVPDENQVQASQSYPGELAVIGNPNEYGRFSRATISGKIVDGASGEPLMGAVLYDIRGGTGASTNGDGFYSMELPVGDHRIRISYVGYDERIQDVRLISSGALDMELFSGSSHLQEVTITARRAEENVSRTQMSLISLDAKAIRELPGSYGEPDVIRSISLLPGIQTIGEFGTGFNVRGGSADQNLILMENAPLFNSSHLFGLISVVNPDLVNSVSLIKAGMPAKYGERASSVMDIRLGSGPSLEKTTLKGGLGILNSRFLLEAPLIKNKLTIGIAGRTSNSDLYLKRMPTEDLMNSAAGFYDLTGVATIAIGSKNRINLFGYHSFDRFSYADETHYSYDNTLASFRWNSSMGSRLSSTFVASISNYRFDIGETIEIQPAANYTMDAGLSYKGMRWLMSYTPNNNHVIEFGINGIMYGIDPGHMKPQGRLSVVPEKIIDSEQASELAAFISDDIILNDKMSLEVGLRYTQYLYLGPGKSFVYREGQPRTVENLIDSVFYGKNEVVTRYHGLEPRFGFRLKTGQTSSVKLSFARINQYINLVTNNSVMGPTDVWKLSDTHLSPLRSDQMALGYFRNFSDNTIEFSAEAYYKFISNAFEHKSGAEIAMNEYIETDIINANGYNYGLELYLRKNTGRLSGWTSYTYSVSRLQTDSPFPESQINNNNFFPSSFDRPHNLVLNSNYQISRRWRFGATFTYNTGRPVTLPELTFRQGDNLLIHYSERNKYRLPDYHRLDLSISLSENLRINQRGKGSWTFSVLNVYGRKNPFTVFYKKDPGGYWTEKNFKLYQMYIIGQALPTITYNFSF